MSHKSAAKMHDVDTPQHCPIRKYYSANERAAQKRHVDCHLLSYFLQEELGHDFTIALAGK